MPRDEEEQKIIIKSPIDYSTHLKLKRKYGFLSVVYGISISLISVKSSRLFIFIFSAEIV